LQEMGNSQSTDDMLRQSNIKLFNFGIEWFQQTKTIKHVVRKNIKYVPENIFLNSSGVDDSKDQENKGKTRNQLYTVHFSHEETKEFSVKPPIVMLHGHSQSAANYYAVLPVLTNAVDRHVFALDMLGCGLSTREKWKYGFGEDCDLKVAESYFVDAIEEWREKMGIEKICLVGHSMGGYVSFCYAEKYPERIENLTLISPVGVPPPGNRDYSNAPFHIRFLFGVIRGGWSRGYSNFNFVNTIGRGYTTDMYCNGRYRPGMSWYNKELVADQMYYNIINGNVSGGGYSHTTLLQFGAYARNPLVYRFPSVFEKLKSVSFIYGESDWMDIRSAENYRDQLLQDGNQIEEAKKISIYKVMGAGHTLTIDNPIATANAIVRSVNQTDHGVTSTMELGLVPLMLDCGISDEISPGMSIEGQWGRWKNDEWRPGRLVDIDEMHGVCKVKWHDSGKVTKTFPLYRVRVPDEVSTKQPTNLGNL